MHRSPVHEIEIVHEWGSPEPQGLQNGLPITVQICEHCGAEQETLDLDQAEDGPSLKDLLEKGTDSDRKKALDEIKDASKRLAEMLETMDAELFAGTEYRDGAHFAAKLRRRYESMVSENEITYRLMKLLIGASHSTKKFRRKILLAYRQGLVCNRCDSIAYSLDDLTEDHIIPEAQGGQSKLLNLQLLCIGCNELKGSGESDGRDQSPYAYKGPPCKHEMTCREVAALRESRSVLGPDLD